MGLVRSPVKRGLNFFIQDESQEIEFITASESTLTNEKDFNVRAVTRNPEKYSGKAHDVLFISMLLLWVYMAKQMKLAEEVN